MQIRLTVVDPQGPPSAARGRAASCDVLVTAPAGTALAAVASALAAAVTGESGAAPSGGAQTVLYAGAERLDAQRCTLGEPPLTDGAVLAVGAPADPEPHPEVDDAPARLDIVAGPDAGGVHLLHGGQIRVGRSADADVPLDDPDVSRLHCAVTLSADGQVTVADLGSTNGTTLDGGQVKSRPVRLSPGALLRVGESALRLAPPGGAGARVTTTPDGEGHVRVACGGQEAMDGGSDGSGDSTGPDASPGGRAGAAARARGDARPSSGMRYDGVPAGAAQESAHARGAGGGDRSGPHTRVTEGVGETVADHARGSGATDPSPSPGSAHARATGDQDPSGPTGHAYGTVDWSDSPAARGERRTRGSGDTPLVPGQGGAPHIESHGGGSRRPGPPGGGLPSATPSGDRTAGSPRPPASSDARPGGGPRPGASSDARTAGGPPASFDDRPAVAETHGGRAGLGSFASGEPGPDARGPHAPASPARSRPPAPPHAQDDGGLDPRVTAPHPDDEAGSQPASRRKGTPLRGTDVPPGVRRRGGLSAWARRLTGGRGGAQEDFGPEIRADVAAAVEPTAPYVAAPYPVPDTWPDPAALLLTALGPGPRLWERGPGHPEALAVRLGTADRAAPDGSGLLPAVPVTAGLREVGALGLAGPRPRLSGLARAVLAQLAALHSPDTLEIVLISTDRARSEEERTAEWSWLGWLPHLRPGHGQDCRLLLAYDRDQATARADELMRRLEDHLADARTAAPAPIPAPRGTARRPSWALADDSADDFPGPYTVVVVDGDPGGADLRGAMTRLASAGPRAGIHVVCLAETPAASPASPVTETYEAACAAAPTFGACGAVALLSGDVATALRLLRVAPTGTAGSAEAAGASGFSASSGSSRSSGADAEQPAGPVGHGTVGTVDAVSAAWTERFARALAPLRPDGTGGERHTRVSAPLPPSARLLDELGLARATPASLMARWADATDDTEALGGRACAVLGAGPRGPVPADLVAEGPHLLIEGPPGSGRTELLRAVVASLAAAERPDRLGIVLIDGRDTAGKSGGGHGDGLRVCTDVPHVTTHLTANDPVRMREFAQSLSAELKRRAELVGRADFAEWHRHRAVSGRVVPQRQPSGQGGGAADLDAPPSSTLRLRPGAAARQRTEAAPPLPRLVVVVDDLDALVSPALGSPGRPAAGSVMRALEAVAREGERLGVHLVAATVPGGRTAESEPARQATVLITLDTPGSGADEPAPGRGRVRGADGRLTPFQAGRVTGRIPRTATLRPTVVPLEWQRMGDPPARRPVRELGNGPTDLALLASALERAAREVAAAEVPSLL
ncbi:FHA domain-containing protein [Streptomyces sp. NPDC002328]|uniref:FHA domain-containing protein n=1 Tax=Streptomyces sp. NPDC002328 TaxID=3364642 RepID=UPI0036B49467